MKRLVFFLEELSARRMLEGVLPRLISSDINVHYVVFQGKSDLEKQLERKLRFWLLPDSIFVVLRDQDAADCHVIKRRLGTVKSKSMIKIFCRPEP